LKKTLLPDTLKIINDDGFVKILHLFCCCKE